MESIKSKKVATIKKRKENELERLKGIGSKGAQLLRLNDINTITDLVSIPIESLKTIPGIGPKTAEKYVQLARNHLNQSVLTHYMTGSSSKKDEIEENGDQNDDYLIEIGGELVELSEEDPSDKEEDWQPNIEGYYQDENEMDVKDNDDNRIEKNDKESNTALVSDYISEQRNQLAKNEKIVHIDKKVEENTLFQSLTPLKIDNPSQKKQESPGPHKSLTPLQEEKIAPSDLKAIISDIEADLKTLDYWILKADQKYYTSLLKNIDLLAIRSFAVSDFLELVILIPIKVSQGKASIAFMKMKLDILPPIVRKP